MLWMEVSPHLQVESGARQALAHQVVLLETPTPTVVLLETPTPRWAADHGYAPHLPELFNPLAGTEFDGHQGVIHMPVGLHATSLRYSCNSKIPYESA